jgi:hypothetical protein
MAKNSNPQGKGLVPVMQSIEEFRPRALLPPKHIEQVARELFSSLFVLNSEFKFSPVADTSYWIYRVDGKFKLFMLAPRQWSGGPPGPFIGECRLHDDITWTFRLDPDAANDPSLAEVLEREWAALVATFEQAETLEDALPRYVAELPFYRRVLAYGLGRSLRASMAHAGILELSYAQSKQLLAGCLPEF